MGPLDLRFLEGTGRSGRRSRVDPRRFHGADLEAKRAPAYN